MFIPPHCPRTECAAHVRGSRFPWRRHGMYLRKCDGRRVQRFKCLTCGRSFSTQSFRVDRGLRRNELNRLVFLQLASKVTLRQLARALGCRRPTVERRLERFGLHSRQFHELRLRQCKQGGGLAGSFALDELETFEGSRKLKPVTVPALVECESYFVVDLDVAPMAARRPLKPHEESRLAAIEEQEGKRRSGSRLAVEKVFRTLGSVVSDRVMVQVRTDKKKTYPGCLGRAIARPVSHVVVSSKRRRDVFNPLFPINFTFAMMRDGLSRLVRRSWAGSKKRARLACHLWLWVGWRNYVRYWTNRNPETRRVSAAQVAGVVRRRLSAAEFLRWRVFPKSWASPAVRA